MTPDHAVVRWLDGITIRETACVNNSYTVVVRVTRITLKQVASVTNDVMKRKVQLAVHNFSVVCCSYDMYICFVDLCSLPMVVGPCNSDVLQWFYDRDSDTCQEFNYGGCQGNRNRFSDQISCERQCKRTPSVVVTESHFLLTTQAPSEIRKFVSSIATYLNNLTEYSYVKYPAVFAL